MRAISRAFLALLAGLAAPGAAPPARAFEPIDFFPLVPGTAWTYDYGGVLGEIVVPPEPEWIGDALAWPLAPTDSEGGVIGEYLTNDALGLRYHGVAVAVGFQDVLVAFDPPLLLSPASAAVPSTHRTNGEAIFEIGPEEVVLSSEATAKLVRFEDVQVPAGRFSALRLDLSYEISGRVSGQALSLRSSGSLWLAEGVGKVKESSTFDGQRLEFELVSFVPVVVPEPGQGGAAALAALLASARAGLSPARRRGSSSRGSPRAARRWWRPSPRRARSRG